MSPCVLVLGVLVGCAAPDPTPGATLPSPDRWLAEDKLQHFAMSFAATGMVYGATRAALERSAARAVAVGTAGALGIGKELVDFRRGGPFSLKDLVWDAVGVALGYAFVQQIE